MDAVVRRLEAVASKLEQHELVLSKGGTAHAVHSSAPVAHGPGPTARAASGIAKPAAGAPAAGETAGWAPDVVVKPRPAATSSSPDDVAQACKTYRETVAAKLQEANSALASEFHASTANFLRGLEAALGIVELAQQRATPSQEELTELVKPLSTAVEQGSKLAHGPRSKSTDHDKALSECLQGLCWVAFPPGAPGMPSPAACLADALTSSEMFLNRVLREFRQTAPEHKAWVEAVKGALKGMQQLCKDHVGSTLTWRGSGSGPASGGAAATQAPAAAAPAPVEAAAAPVASVEPPPVQAPTAGQGRSGPPPPPPPPAPGSLFEKRPAGGGEPDVRGQLMAALASGDGDGAASRLKHVTDDMKTKNREGRTGLVTPAGGEAKPAAVAKAKAKEPVRAKPPLKELAQRRWRIENFVGGDPIVLEDSEVKRDQTICMSKCKGCVLQVNGKVNSILLDGCSKVGLVFDAVVATAEMVNCSDVQIQCNTACPTMTIEKTDGAQIFLTKDASGATEIVSSKSSGMNVSVLEEAADDADPVVHPIPDQYIHKFVDGRLQTHPAMHAHGHC